MTGLVRALCSCHGACTVPVTPTIMGRLRLLPLMASKQKPDRSADVKAPFTFCDSADEIPAELARLPNLEMMALTNNKISGSLFYICALRKRYHVPTREIPICAPGSTTSFNEGTVVTWKASSLVNFMTLHCLNCPWFCIYSSTIGLRRSCWGSMRTPLCTCLSFATS